MIRPALRLALCGTAHAVTPSEGSLVNRDDAFARVRLHAEVGFLAPLAHTLQLGRDGTRFDYLAEGGQNNLFPFGRLSADLDLGPRHSIVALWQPLDLRTTSVPERDIVVNGATFAAGEPLDLRYGFSFYRLSWLYDTARADDVEIGVGASLQLRNAAIGFESADGSLRRDNRDIGPVPTLKTRLRAPVGEHTWLGAEVDAMWAPIRYLNGRDVDVEGAIVDGSLRAGFDLRHGTSAFLNVRYLGGGAVGTGRADEVGGDGYVANWLHTVSLSLGVSLR